MKLIAALLLAALVATAHAHGEDAAIPTTTGLQRLPDGAVFLPKPAQRALQVRTLPVKADDLARSTELHGTVVMDPNAGGLVQATQAGRLSAGPGGLPSLGQRVQRGQVLAYLEPSNAALERSAQAAQVAELRAARELAERRLARLQALADTVPRREIEAAQSELAGLQGRLQALSAGLTTREALVAPVSGVIASAQALAGQVVEARDVLFEIVDPQRLRIEALAYDAALANDLAAAFLAQAGPPQPLKFLGAGAALREQALPLAFAVHGRLSLALGQPVRVIVHSRSTVKGMALPATAVMKNPANQTIVWVKRQAEQFEPRLVQTQPLDGTRVVVLQGLAEGERVVTQGASLINQVR